MADGSISKQGHLLVKKDSGDVINLADIVEAMKLALVDAPDDTLGMKMALQALKKLSVNSSGQLRVGAESIANMTTLTNVTNMGTSTIGALAIIPLAQADSMARYQQGFRRNLVVT